MRGGAQTPVKIIGPGMIRTGNRPVQPFGLINQNHTAVTTDIFKHFDLA